MDCLPIGAFTALDLTTGMGSERRWFRPATPADALVKQFQLTLQADDLTQIRADTILKKADPDTQIRPLVSKIDQGTICRMRFWHALSGPLKGVLCLIGEQGGGWRPKVGKRPTSAKGESRLKPLMS